MAENPLLPHRKLQELRALMLRLAALNATPGHHLEALKAATLLHLEPGDFALPPSGHEDLTPPAAVTKSRKSRRPAANRPAPTNPLPSTRPTADRIAIAAGIAQGFRLAKLDRAVLVYTDPATVAKYEPGWAAALEFATRALLPLIVVCVETPAKSPRPNSPLTWNAVQKLSFRCALPLVSVDGEDAVALYRVLQESMLHARIGAGPVLIWALCSGGKLKPAQFPVKRLEAYMRVRRIPLA